MAADREMHANLQAHVKSYSNFAWMMKWGTVVSFITAAVVILLIAS